MSLLLALMLATAASGAKPADLPACPERDNTPLQPPAYPAEEEKANIGGTTKLLLTVDRCGFVVDAQVSESAGNRNLDIAAIAAAKTWRLAASGWTGSHATVPIVWTPPNAVRHMRTRDEHFVERRRELIPHVAAHPVPGFVPDPYPLGYASVASARADVAAMTDAMGDSDTSEWVRYQVIDEEGLSLWWFAKAFPAVVRMRATGDGTRGLYVASYLCESTKSDCDRMVAWLKDQPAQNDIPPPPPMEEAAP